MTRPHTEADRAEAQRIWDEGHAKIAGQAADASWLAERAHVETLADYLAAERKSVSWPIAIMIAAVVLWVGLSMLQGILP